MLILFAKRAATKTKIPPIVTIMSLYLKKVATLNTIDIIKYAIPNENAGKVIIPNIILISITTENPAFTKYTINPGNKKNVDDTIAVINNRM